jgi:transcriptional regulator with XRE-family HTH domain
MEGLNKMNFNTRLKEVRSNLGLTQEQFAAKLGFSRTTVTELESGNKKPTLKTIQKLSQKTNTKISYWLDEGDDTEIKVFDGLKMVIDTLIDVGEINESGKCSDKGINLLLKMLEKEIPLYMNSKKN